MTIAADIRSHFSIGESLLTPKQAIEKVKEAGYSSAAIVDTMSISSMPDFTNAAEKAGVKPIIGVRLRIPTSLEKEKKQTTVFPVLYILSDEGFKRITRLLSKANDADHFYYVARTCWEDVLEAVRDGQGHLAFSTGGIYSALRHPNIRPILERVSASLRASSTFVQITPSHSAVWDRQAFVGYQTAEELKLPILLSRPSIFAEDGMWSTFGIMGAISSNGRARSSFNAYVDDYAPEAPAKLLRDAVAQFKRLQDSYGLEVSPELLRAASKNWDGFKESCNFKWHKLDVSLPKMADDENAELKRLAKEGLKWRLTSEVFGYKPESKRFKEYADRLGYELDVLTGMGFSGYFLLVREIVDWSKSNGIKVGPGRGSVGGSLLAYVLGITDVDPIRFDLIFERFINPERIDLPDIDLDFMSERRHEIVEFLEKKYGKSRVAGISNYMMLGSKSALQDITRVLEMPMVDRVVSKTIPEEQGTAISLERAINEVPEIAEFAAKEPDVWQHALNLEGRMRTLSRHAAGVVVAGEDLVERAVVETRSGEQTVNWDKRTVEEMGLVKIDVLGLSTLDLIEMALRKIRARGGDAPNLDTIPLDDERVLQEFGKGNTVGVFQFESGGMQKLLRSLAAASPLTFEDLSAATALYRPGPMESGLLDNFVAIRQGDMMPDYPHESTKEALRETEGVLVYQEQVMRVSRDLSGFTGPEADHLRKAIGKKDKEKMATMGDKFIKGAVKTGMSEDGATDLWDKIVKFAGYSFNKSHSVEYSLISYQTMWLKTYHPLEFYAAAMSIASSDKMQSLLRDAHRNSVAVLPPDVNVSTAEFEIAADDALVAPLSAVKGLSAKGTQLIMEKREDGPFKSMEDFRERLPPRNVNKTVMDKLDRVGAFAKITPGAPLASDERRREDQLSFIPDVMIGGIYVTRTIPRDKITLGVLRDELSKYKRSKDSIISSATFSSPKMGKEPKFMAVFDGPSWSEESALQFTAGKSFGIMQDVLDELGMEVSDGYWTGLCKAPKLAGEKIYTQGQIASYAPLLRREIEILKPQVIVTLGTNAMRFFLPKVKGGCQDNAGRIIYNPHTAEGANDDYNLVIGITPGMLAFDESRAELLVDAMNKVKEMIW